MSAPKNQIELRYVALAFDPEQQGYVNEQIMDALSDARDAGWIVEWALVRATVPPPEQPPPEGVYDGNSPEMLRLFDSVRVSPHTHDDNKPRVTA